MSHTTPAQSIKEIFTVFSFNRWLIWRKSTQRKNIVIMNALVACARYGNRRDVQHLSIRLVADCK